MRKKIGFVVILGMCVFMGCGSNTENVALADIRTEAVQSSEIVADTAEAEESFAVVVDTAEPERSSEVRVDTVDTGAYSVATSVPSDEVEQFASNVKAYLLDEDWAALSEVTFYPIRLNDKVIENADAFVQHMANYDFGDQFIQDISDETCVDMFCNYQGIMMGQQGEIWLSEVGAKGKLYVFAINVIE